MKFDQHHNTFLFFVGFPKGFLLFVGFSVACNAELTTVVNGIVETPKILSQFLGEI